MHALGPVLLALLLLTGCGDDPTAPGQARSSTDGSSRTTEAAPRSDGPEGQPPADGPAPDTRTGAVPLGGTCPQRYDAGSVGQRGLAFDGRVESVGSGRVGFRVEEWFAGEAADRVTLRMAPPQSPRRSDSSPSYSVGTRLLVSGDDATAWGCGWTRYFDEETAAAWRS